LADVNWKHGSLVTPRTPDEPESLGKDDSIAALLDEAEEIVRNAGPDIFADIEEDRIAEEKRNKGLGRFFRRRKKE